MAEPVCYHPRSVRSNTFAIGMAAVAWLSGLAIHLNDGYYSRGALFSSLRLRSAGSA